ncbi:MAG: glycosyltransferase family 4 protein [Phycisphaerae bacterium]|nr:glycosyltransferase family 4 protein [Phycisphaerae bacterium]
MTAPVLIVLPQGLNVSGVTVWAVRLAGALAARGRPVTLLLHAEPAVQGRIGVAPHPDVRVLRPAGLPALGPDEPDTGGPFEARMSKLTPAYLAAFDQAGPGSDAPLIVIPNLHADSYAAAVEAARARPGRTRVIGWQHSDIAYDLRVLEHFEPALSAIVAVSDRIESRWRDARAARPGPVAPREGERPPPPIENIPYGVPIPGAVPVRPPLRGESGPCRPLRLIYSGRLEHFQKRVLALVHLSDQLASRDVWHEMSIVGDGPARADLAGLVREHGAAGRVALLGPSGPARVLELLDAHDVLVLPSRYEGLSVSMLEAMSRGCVPVLARTDSGAAQAVTPGVDGEIAPVSMRADESEAGVALAEATIMLLRRDPTLERTRAAAYRTAGERFSIGAHADRVSALLDRVASEPSRAWPPDRPVEFGGSVGPDASVRLAALLDQLRGRAVAVHGTGRHTAELWRVFAAGPARLVALCDDDRQRHGTRAHGLPVVAPEEAGRAGATDIIISSFMHQDAIWARRDVYRAQGLAVHRIYR